MSLERSSSETTGRLLVEWLAHGPLPASEQRPDALASGSIDWTGLIGLALQHGVTVDLARILLARQAPDLPPDIRVALAEYLRRERERAGKAVADLRQILAALGGAGVRAVPFKGPMLAEMLHGRGALRTCRDLDFLVPREELDRCLAVLAELGYRSQHNLRAVEWRAFHRYAGEDIMFRTEADLPIEPHWAVTPRTLAIDIDYAAIWQRTRPATFAGLPVLAFDPTDLFLLLCVHGAKEQWARLRWICDIAALTGGGQAIDWLALCTRARSQGCFRMVALALAAASLVLHVPLPAPAAHLFPADTATNRLLSELTSRLFLPNYEAPSIYAISWFRLHMRERRRDRLRYMLRTITTPRVPHYRLVRMPAALFGATVAVKVVHDYVLLPLWTAAGPIRDRIGPHRIVQQTERPVER
jgi:hypothetical protein